jgi:hypothetical protein
MQSSSSGSIARRDIASAAIAIVAASAISMLARGLVLAMA